MELLAGSERNDQGMIFHVKFCQIHIKYPATFARNKKDKKDEDFAGLFYWEGLEIYYK